MQHIKTIFHGNFNKTKSGAGCGECQTSCQSACKTSCTVANQNCEQTTDILNATTLRKKPIDIRIRKK
jgi:predicted ribosomally synthesized six-cysteine peptide SCIFF